MTRSWKGVGPGLIGGAVGLVAMQLVQRLTAGLVRTRTPRPLDVFPTERSMSPFGPRHHPDESATDAIGRIAYRKLTGREPSEKRKRALSWGVHLGYGFAVAALYGALHDRPSRRGWLFDGAMLGGALWLFGDELVVPLFGLSDKPTAYHPTRHLQSLAMHLGYGMATAATDQQLRRL
ncbi:MAG: hypothetical protein ACTHU0_18970 [Kofleriaceae bacterium]